LRTPVRRQAHYGTALDRCHRRLCPLLLTKNPLIAGGGAIGGAALGYLDVQMRVKDQLSFCLAVAARDNNDCIKNTCHAWMLPLALLPLRRRYNEKVKEAQA
jgi:hypothetical protein